MDQQKALRAARRPMINYGTQCGLSVDPGIEDAPWPSADDHIPIVVRAYLQALTATGASPSITAYLDADAARRLLRKFGED